MTGTQAGPSRTLNRTFGALELTTQQAEKLAVRSYCQFSPYLEPCCLRLRATVADEQAEQIALAFHRMLRVIGSIALHTKSPLRLFSIRSSWAL